MAFSSSIASTTDGPHAEGIGTSAYTHGPVFRSSAYMLVGGTLVLAVFVLWAALTGAPTLDWVLLLVLVLVNVHQSVGELLSTLQLTEDRLRQERPLHSDSEVRFREIRRLFVGGMTVEIYTSSESEPTLTLSRKLRNGDDLVERLVRALPEDAEVDHPSGELAGRLSEARPA